MGLTLGTKGVEVMYFFEIIQHNVRVVSGYCPDLATATEEVSHYISQYGEDGPIDMIVIKDEDSRKRCERS